MKFFPDREQRKQVMKTVLPWLIAIAWSPIVGLMLFAILGKPLAGLTGSSLFALGVSGIITLVLVFLFLKLFRRIGKAFYGDSQ